MEPTRTPRKTSELLTLIGNEKYQIKLDESIFSFPIEERKKEIVWCEYIPAYEGMIYLSCASPLEFAFFTKSIGKINTIEKKLGDFIKCVKMDGEGIIYFGKDIFKKIASLAKAKTKRKLTDEHKKKLQENLKKWREEQESK